MTRIDFATEPGVYLLGSSFNSDTVPRVGEEVCLKIQKGSLYETFVVEKVSWYGARDPGEGLEAEVQLILCEGGGWLTVPPWAASPLSFRQRNGYDYNMTEVFTFFEVGGAVRDSLMGLSSKDVDFSVVARPGLFQDAAAAFEALESDLAKQGFKIFESRPEFLTIRAQVPLGHVLRGRTTVADFVLARKDGPYSDGRRPDFVLPGSLKDDIFRRDFSINALARNTKGEIIDLVGGVEDLESQTLRFVGDPRERIAEDGLRVMRGFRFHITKGFKVEEQTWEVCTSEFGAEMLSRVSAERVREELNKMFRANTLHSLRLLGELPHFTQEAIFRDGLRLDATFAH